MERSEMKEDVWRMICEWESQTGCVEMLFNMLELDASTIGKIRQGVVYAQKQTRRVFATMIKKHLQDSLNLDALDGDGGGEESKRITENMQRLISQLVIKQKEEDGK